MISTLINLFTHTLVHTSLSTCVLVLALSLKAYAYDYNTSADIYMIGDVHGAYDELETILKHSKLVDDKLDWVGGNAHFVSTGDLMDRGPKSRKIMDLLIKLQQQAEEAGGKVHILLGNHEVLNLIGDWRYISIQEYLEFANDESPQMRNEYYEKYLDFRNLDKSATTLTAFNKSFPSGFFARLEAFMPDGFYGKWLHTLPVVIKINTHIFTHGGLSLSTKSDSLSGLNEKLIKELNDYTSAWSDLIRLNVFDATADYVERFSFAQINAKENPRRKRQRQIIQQLFESAQGMLYSNDSPNWYRGNAVCHPLFETQILNEALTHFGADTLWVGHTSAPTVRQRFDNTLLLMDTGMLKQAYGGQPIYAHIFASQPESNSPDTPWQFVNANNGELVSPSSVPNRRSINPDGMTDEQTEEMLRTAKVIDKKSLGEGVTNPWKITLSYNDKTYTAVFKHHDSGNDKDILRAGISDRYQYEVAAYKLDRMLDMNVVPVTAERKISGERGAIQVWIHDLINYNQMMEKKIEYDGDCDYTRQRQMLEVFDYLIHNVDRNRGNIGFSKDDWQIWFYDHTQAFRTSTKRSKIGKDADLTLTPEFKIALQNLDDQELKTLSRWLTSKQIRTLKKRRDQLLENNT